MKHGTNKEASLSAIEFVRNSIESQEPGDVEASYGRLRASLDKLSTMDLVVTTSSMLSLMEVINLLIAATVAAGHERKDMDTVLTQLAQEVMS